MLLFRTAEKYFFKKKDCSCKKVFGKFEWNPKVGINKRELNLQVSIHKQKPKACRVSINCIFTSGHTYISSIIFKTLLFILRMHFTGYLFVEFNFLYAAKVCFSYPLKKVYPKNVLSFWSLNFIPKIPATDKKILF